MKKLLTCSVFAALLAFSACAQKLNAAKVPAEVKSAFAKMFPGTNATWEKENAKEYEAAFTMNGKEASANFLANGSWVETEMEIAIADLPKAVSNAVIAKYPAAVIKKIFKIDNASGAVTYEAEIKDGAKTRELVLDAAGKIIH